MGFHKGPQGDLQRVAFKGQCCHHAFSQLIGQLLVITGVTPAYLYVQVYAREYWSWASVIFKLFNNNAATQMVR